MKNWSGDNFQIVLITFYLNFNIISKQVLARNIVSVNDRKMGGSSGWQKGFQSHFSQSSCRKITCLWTYFSSLKINVRIFSVTAGREQSLVCPIAFGRKLYLPSLKIQFWDYFCSIISCVTSPWNRTVIISPNM